jgi:hypothetical protein
MLIEGEYLDSAFEHDEEVYSPLTARKDERSLGEPFLLA